MTTPIALLIASAMTMGVSFGQHSGNKAGITKPKTNNTNKIHVGTASFYANKFNGRKTANGDVFDQKNLTGACNIIPLNTWVKVTNLRNKRHIVVKITDRMHPQNKRLIDLSRSAAGKLGYTGRGLTKVKVEVLGKNQPKGWTIDGNTKQE
jgi:rare lipoprotein A